MRARLLDATIECLAATGYSAMSTNDVVRVAGVSRGALAHHFPTKADLVGAAAERLIALRAREFRAHFGALPARRRTPARALEVLWSFYDDPTFTALVELTVAARHHPELRAVFASTPDEIADITSAVFAEFFPALARRPFVDEVLRGIHALYTGLALQAMSDDDAHGHVAAVRSLLTTLLTLASEETA